MRLSSSQLICILERETMRILNARPAATFRALIANFWLSAPPILTCFVTAVALMFCATSAVALPTTGLVGFWAADGDATDSAGSNHGTLSGTTSYTTGQFGQAFDMSGGGGTVDLSPNVYDSLYAGGEITISAWLNISLADVGDRSALIFEGNWILYFDRLQQGVPTAVWDGNYTNRIGSGGVAINDGNWHHVAMTYSAGTASIYVDGGLQASGARTLTNGASNILGSGLFDPWDGAIDEVAIYDRALSTAEIASGWNTSSVVPEPSTGLLVATGLAGLAYNGRRKS